MTGCRELRVEHLREPRGIGTRAPRFSWIVDHPQLGYRLRVVLADTVVWDTGRVAGADTVLVPYGGAPLASNRDYVWTVWTWDAAGEVATASSRFSTALLDAGDYRAPWVQPVQEPTAVEEWTLFDWIQGRTTDAPPEERLRPVQLMRQEFFLTEQPVRARLYATARGSYSAWLNGIRAGDEVLSPGFDSYEHRISVQCFDVMAALQPGANALAVALADGWWAGRLGITGSSAQWGATTSAWWQLHLEFADGTERVVSSGPDARSATGPWRYADLFVGEVFDARAEPDRWRRPGFDASGWAPVAATDADVSMLVPFTGEPVRRVRELPAVSVDERDGATIVDFGQVIAGRVRLRVRGAKPGQRVTIEHTELLAPDGSWFQNITGMNKEQTDVYVARGGAGVEEWEPEFTFHGFRYARVTGAAIAQGDIVAVVIASDLEEAGSFSCSDPALNRLHENVVWSQRGNFLSIPTDCPQRERAGWTGDIQVFAPAATNNALVAPFLARWLANVRADQAADGSVPIFSPRSPYDIRYTATMPGPLGIESAAGWGDAIVLVPWTLWQRCGDRRVLEENYVAMTRWVGYQATAAYRDAHHFGDWLAPSTLEGPNVHEAIQVAPALTGGWCAQAFRVRSLDLIAKVAGVLGHDADADRYAADARAARTEFAAAHLDADGRIDVELQGTYVLALAFDLVPRGLRDLTVARLVELIHARGDRLDTGFLSVPYLLDVLWDSGHADLARRLLWQREMPSWLYEVDRGATTIWESWDAVVDGESPHAVSLNHYAFGCVDDVLFRRIAGLRPTDTAWASATIEPDLDGPLARASAHVSTPYGRLAVDWERTGDAVTVRTTVPHGIRARLVVGGTSRALEPGEREEVIARH